MSFNDYWQAEQRRRAVAAAIAGMKPGDGEAEERFFRSLQDATLILAVAELPPGMVSGDLLAGKGKQVKIRMLRGKDNRHYVPVFTSEEHFRWSHGADGTCLLVPFPVIAHMAISASVAGVMIDRSGPTSAFVPTASLQRFLPQQRLSESEGQEQEEKSESGQPPQMQIGPCPRPINQREVAVLDRWLRAQPGLHRAYLFGLLRADGQSFLTVGLGFPEAPAQERVKVLAEELSQILGQAGILLLDHRLTARLADQAGAIRFDIKEEKSAPTEPGSPPSDHPPAPTSPGNQTDR